MATYTRKQLEDRRRAVERYAKTVDRVNCQLPAGTKERIKALSGLSCNAFIKNCVLSELDRLERLSNINK